MDNLFINKKTWQSFTEAEMEEYVNSVFSYYRANGFPYFPTDKKTRDNEFRKLMNYDASGVLRDGVVNQTMHGLSLAWSYMPHSWNVVCGNYKTPMEVFNNDDLFLQVIRKRIRMGDNMSDNGIRKMLKMFTGTQAVSNFRPTAACTLYENYAGKGSTVLDMSMGYGGRFLGAMKAEVNYVGFDPSIEQYEGVKNMYNDFKSHTNQTFEFHNVGSEFISLESGSIDFAFTSPPYYDTEKYSNEESQSYIKYPTKEKWLNEFLGQTFDNVKRCLRDGGSMAINIANVKSYPDLESDVVDLAKKIGYNHTDTLALSLSNSTFKKGKCAFKYEPIFIFKKFKGA